MKVIIFDASTLISLAMNGLLPELKKLKAIFKGKFLITQEVKKEVIDKPITIKRFELEALKLKQLFDESILEAPASLNINDAEITKKAKEIMQIANTTFTTDKKDVRLIDFGEGQ